MESFRHEDAPSRTTDSSAHVLVPHGTHRKLREVLARLNARTRYRYTGVYRVAPPVLENVGLFDRENPTLNVSGDIHLLEETYCNIVRETRKPFLIDDSHADARVAEHPARDRIVSYCGIPLHVDGEIHGVLCHYDPRPRIAPPGEMEFLRSMEPELAAFLAS